MSLSPEEFLVNVARLILSRSCLWPTAGDLITAAKPQFICLLVQSDYTSAALNDLLHTDGCLKGTSKRALWRGFKPSVNPFEQTTQTLCIISFLQECYLVNQCRLRVTVFPFNFINNSFFCCLGSLVRQTKLQCCQVCWWPTVMLAEHCIIVVSFWCSRIHYKWIFLGQDLLLYLCRSLDCKFSRSSDFQIQIWVSVFYYSPALQVERRHSCSLALWLPNAGKNGISLSFLHDH